MWETQTPDRDFYGQKKTNNSLPPRELCFTILFITNVNKKNSYINRRWLIDYVRAKSIMGLKKFLLYVISRSLIL
jgi:hypothetical protein